MTPEFQQMLHLAAIGATGHDVAMDCTDIEWNKVIRAAKIQKMDGFLGFALKRNKRLPCPAEVRDPLIRDARALGVSNALHRAAVIQLLEEMENEGIHAVLLKGYAIADCYSVPQCRICGDTDIWVDSCQEQRACEFLRSRGFVIKPRWKRGHHAVCTHPVIGCVEVHVILYDEIVEDLWFGTTDGSEFVTEPHRYVRTEDGSFYTMGYTDHMIFLALHMIKHFILSGFTVQMMMDVALYFKIYASSIDTARLWDTINRLRYGKLFNAILWTMILHCGFQPQDFPGICPEPSEHVTEILDDLEQGGWMGSTDRKDREEGWYVYNRQVMTANKSGFRYWQYMMRWKFDLFRNALFPRKELLAMKYPYICRWPVLIPFAWLHRLVFRGFRAVNRAIPAYIVTDEEEISTTGNARFELFRKLDMLE